MKAILVAGFVSFVLALATTPLVARMFVRSGLGQPIHDLMPEEHQVKAGTPTMGGLVIIAAAVVGYLAAHLLLWQEPTVSAVLLLLLTIGLGVVGFVDDYLKITRERNLGIRGRAKILGQTLVAVGFGVLALRFADTEGVTPASTMVSVLRDVPAWQLGTVGFVVFVLLMVSATSNGVNLTDGLDGLATGSTALVLAGYTMICIWQFNQSCSTVGGPGCYHVRDPYDLAVVAISLGAACVGFLWWNCNPARIFPGDTGALALGGAVAGLAIMTKTELLLIVIGGLYVMTSASVIIQRGYFKATRRLTGIPRRVFLMSPLQFHFQLKGWDETTIVVRFWIICGALVAAGLGLFYGEWITHG